jgi:hypothetical protein
MDIFVTRRNGLSVGAPVADARSNSPGQRAAREDDWRRYFAAPHGCNHEQAELLAPSPPRLAPALILRSGHPVDVTGVGVKQPRSARRATTSPRPALVLGRASRPPRRRSWIARRAADLPTVPSGDKRADAARTQRSRRTIASRDRDREAGAGVRRVALGIRGRGGTPRLPLPSASTTGRSTSRGSRRASDSDQLADTAGAAASDHRACCPLGEPPLAGVSPARASSEFWTY